VIVELSSPGSLPRCVRSPSTSAGLPGAAGTGTINTTQDRRCQLIQRELLTKIGLSSCRHAVLHSLREEPVEHDIVRVREFGAELTEQEWADLAQHGRPRRLPTGTSLFIEGTRSDTVVVVISGRVKVFTSAEDGAEVILAVRGPGALLGELAAIDKQPSSASVRPLEPVEVLTVGHRQFTTFLQAHPRMMWVLMRILTDRLRDADRQRIEFGVYDTLNRVAHRLVELVDRFGEPTESGIRITLPITQDELASWVGASREAVTKALRTLRACGYVQTQRRTLTVIDIEGLRRRAR
jgi:CRP/FNR family cyclic AMP-dependent transcriptional regulator